MSRWSAPAAVDDAPDQDPGPPVNGAPEMAVAADLGSLSIAGITRRRMTILTSVLLASLIVVAFVRQVGEAADATTRAEYIASANAAMRIEVAGLERELDLIGRQRYIEQQARAYGLGTSREVPFTLAADAPPLPADAPGSAAVRVGASIDAVTPLERWLTVLFGPAS